MKIKLSDLVALSVLSLPPAAIISGCGQGKPNPQTEAPPTAVVEAEMNPNNFTVEQPERFKLTNAAAYKSVSALDVTGVVQPDIARAVPVISLAAGRVVEINARLGDEVKQGQVLLRVRSNDVSTAYQTYLKAENDERLAKLADDRTRLLYDHGAAPKSAVEQADDVEQDAQVDLQTAREQLRLLGADKDNFTGTVDIKAPISGVITDQQVTNAAGAQGLPGPNPFTISDLSYVWVMCDVYENDLDAVKLEQIADIRLNAYPGRVLKARIDNIFPILDPNIRTAKVRLEVPNPGKIMKVGMFATATFYGRTPQTHAAVPASAILHLHDRTWVYIPVPQQAGHFRRIEVQTGNMLPGNQEEVLSGLQPGQQAIQDALAFNNTVEQ